MIVSPPSANNTARSVNTRPGACAERPPPTPARPRRRTPPATRPPQPHRPTAGTRHATPPRSHRPTPTPSDTPRYAALDKCLPRKPKLNPEEVQNRLPARHFVTSTASVDHQDQLATATAGLEGTFASLEDVLAADVSEGDVTGDLREVLNYIEAADFAFDSLNAHPAITKSLLEQAHAILVQGTEAGTVDKGRIRQCQVAIGSPTGRIRDSRFVPMPPGADLEDSVRRLVAWCEEALSKDIEPLVATAMVHYQFETLHPFNDGNGRIGRLLIVLQFLRYNLIRNPLLSVSPWFEQRRSEYQEGLANVSVSGDWDPWVQFFARGICASAEDTARRVERLSSVQKQYVDILQAENASGSIRDIVDRLIATPIVTVPRLSATLGKTRPAINTSVARLVDLQILRGPYGSYNRRFIAQDILDAIQAPMGDVPNEAPPRTAEVGGRVGGVSPAGGGGLAVGVMLASGVRDGEAAGDHDGCPGWACEFGS